MDKRLLALYINYLLRFFGAMPAPGLSALEALLQSHALCRVSPMLLRQILRTCQPNWIPYRHVLADYKTLKAHAALAKVPTKRQFTQNNSCFIAPCAAGRLESLKIKHQRNHFALRSRLYLKTIRYVCDKLQTIKTA